MKPKLTRTNGMRNSDPFRRSAIKLYRLREYAQCLTEWPSADPDDGDHVHKCFKHRGHMGGYHKCNCGVSTKYGHATALGPKRGRYTKRAGGK